MPRQGPKCPFCFVVPIHGAEPEADREKLPHFVRKIRPGCECEPVRDDVGWRYRAKSVCWGDAARPSLYVPSGWMPVHICVQGRGLPPTVRYTGRYLISTRPPSRLLPAQDLLLPRATDQGVIYFLDLALKALAEASSGTNLWRPLQHHMSALPVTRTLLPTLTSKL